MIVFDLRCGDGHVFEAWFRSSSDFARQRDDGLVACPICASTAVDKAVMAPNVAAKGNRGSSGGTTEPATAGAGTDEPEAAAAKRLLAAIAGAQAKLLADSQWVGSAFADRARSMHLGDEPVRPIHGQASGEEARALIDEGIAVAPLLVPVVPPDLCN